jgi:phasin
MNESFNPQVNADKARDTYRRTAAQFEDWAFDTPLVEAMRTLAENNVAQTREAYEHSKDALEAALETLERSFDALGQGATAINHKIMEIAQRGIDSNFDLAKSLAGAKNLTDVIELQAAHWRKRFDVLAAQAEEMRSLSTQVTTDTVKPAKDQVTRGMDKLRKAARPDASPR